MSDGRTKPTNGRDGRQSVGPSVIDDLGNGLSDWYAEDLITKDTLCLAFTDEVIFYTRVSKMEFFFESYDRLSLWDQHDVSFSQKFFHVSDPLLGQSHSYKGSLARALISSLMLTKRNCWTTISVAGQLRGHDAHYMCIHRCHFQIEISCVILSSCTEFKYRGVNSTDDVNTWKWFQRQWPVVRVNDHPPVAI